MRSLFSALRGVALGLGLAAALAGLSAAPAAAEPASCAPQQLAMTPPVPVELDRAPNWSYAQFRGVGCERCNNTTQYCVVNFVRWEYVCAPRAGATFACAGSQGTRWCRAGQTCWDGVCR